MNKLPSYDTLVDGQIVTVTAADGITKTFKYDAQTRALTSVDCGTSTSCKHGSTHIAEDPIPTASCDSPGLMSPNDKCKLDTLTGTKIGVLGFVGSGMPDDGGFISGDVILSSGSDFITIEKIGNIIRFNVDIPTPLRCNCDECAEIFLVQDTTAIDKIRPSICAGKMPGLNVYNEFAAYLVPKNAAASASNVDTVLSTKDKYPAFIFKRFNDNPGLAEVHFVLKRTSATDPTTEIGWSMTPGGTTSGSVSTLVFNMGRDTAGNLNRFQFAPDNNPNLLGALFYKGNLLTKKPAVITGYTESIIGDNRYNVKFWDVLNNAVVGEAFTAKNIWEYKNPENAVSGTNPQTLKLDSSAYILPIGTIIDLYAYQVGSNAAGPIYRYFFSKQPQINVDSLWALNDYVKFGDELICRDEAIGGTGGVNNSVLVNDVRNFEKDKWGLTGFDDPLFYDSEGTGGSDIEVNYDNRVNVDIAVPGLVVSTAGADTSNVPVKPVYLWNRSNFRNFYFKTLIGRGRSSDFTPIDFVFRSAIDSWDTRYAFVNNVYTVGDHSVVEVSGVNIGDLPPSGTIRVLNSSVRRGFGFNYAKKSISMFPGTGGYELGRLKLIGYNNELCEVEPGDVVELVHQDYNCQVLRLEYTLEPSSNVQRIQFKVGTLDTALVYEQNLNTSAKDDFVRGLKNGYTVSAVYSQDGFYNGTGNKPLTAPDNFIIYDGGFNVGGAEAEYWNELEVMARGGQLWVWWNKLLVPPDPAASLNLPTPVTVNTPYFSVPDRSGKVGLRMFAGAKVRSCEIRTQVTQYNEFVNGNLKIV